MKVCRTLFLSLAWITTLSVADAQIVTVGSSGAIRITSSRTEIPPELLAQMEMMDGMTSDPAASAATDPAAESPLLQKLKSVVYDRRPSAMLKAWSTPAEEEPPKPAPPPPSETEPEADGSSATLPVDSKEPGAASASPSNPEAAESSPDSTSSETTPAVDADKISESTTPAGTTTPVEGDAESVTATEESETTEADRVASAEAEAAKKAAEEAAKKEAAKAAAEKAAAAKKAAEVAAAHLEWQVKTLQRNVTLGNWSDVKAYLGGIPEADGKGAYQQILKSLLAGPEPPKQPYQQYVEKNHFAPDDAIGLAEAAPVGLEKPDLKTLGQFFRMALDEGAILEPSLEPLRLGIAAEGARLGRRESALLLFAANEPIAAGEFLPSAADAIEANDREALNLLARHYLAVNEKEEDSSVLEQAWTVTQAVLATGDVKDEEKEEGLKRAVNLAPRLRDELGQAWLDESFTSRPERGMEIVAVIGGDVSKGLKELGRDADLRFKGLELQTTAANALLTTAPERATDWKATLELLAKNWLREAEHTYSYDQSTQRGPSMQRDYYGNYFYYQQNFNQRNGIPAAITTDNILKIRPSDAWLATVDSVLRPHFDEILGRLYLKMSEENEAFPYIELLARDYPERGKELVDEFLRVWTANHDPNSSSRRTDSYMYFYGFESRAEAIPLTRSKQERNLKELSEWVARLRKLPVELDETLLSVAFTSAHSTAEVYRLETIEQVFGSLEGLDTKTLAELVQRMRGNLAEQWRDPEIQKASKTKRRKKDIQNEVLRGYDIARRVIDDALRRHPNDWSLELAGASLMHDEVNYRQEVAKSSQFANDRHAALERFERAADAYVSGAATRAQKDESTTPFELWFYASLGACDLKAIDDRTQAIPAQYERIRAALEKLPAEANERHVTQFANALFSRMSNVNPAVKFRYVKGGLEVVGDHERAAQARDVYEYYRDLVTEIQLEVTLDGATRVDAKEPFGAFIDLRHTREIERESGGFSKYLTNQNNQGFSYNYGRPTEDYRDKFDEAARQQLDEQFEVLSITFNHPDTHSRADEEYGWRITPYAYLLLKPRGPEVDRIPPLHLDLDFLDTTGYAVIPVESAAVPIEVGEGPDRPFHDLAITQTLDERQASDKKLLVEVKATARGLVPPLSSILDLAPAGFNVTHIDDQGVSVTEFDKESEDVAIVADRTWMVTFLGEEGQESLPSSFAFGTPVVPAKEMTYQRFVDADLASVASVVSLEHQYGTESKEWFQPTLAVLALLIFAVGAVVMLRPASGGTASDRRFAILGDVTPFTVIGLLRDIDRHNGIDATRRTELTEDIRRIESFYFEDAKVQSPDLDAIAKSWLDRVN